MESCRLDVGELEVGCWRVAGWMLDVGELEVGELQVGGWRLDALQHWSGAGWRLEDGVVQVGLCRWQVGSGRLPVGGCVTFRATVIILWVGVL